MLIGGGGIDTLIGGDSDDTYIVDSTTDVIIEGANGGNDTVVSSITFSLAAIANVENLTLTGTENINGTGNSLSNVLTGNSGANILDGGGGIDTIIGGDGDDTYIVDSTTDVIIEGANGGNDTVVSSITFSLAAIANVENLTLTGTENINGTGNSLSNVLTGNSGANILDGGGGIDTLIGGDGKDFIDGGRGKDVIDGGRGKDVIIGGRGADTLVGGRGKDRFVYARVVDSTAGNSDVVTWDQDDRFDLSGIDANPSKKGLQSLEWIAGKSFSGQIGELRTTATCIQADLNGDTIADLEIHLQSTELLQRVNLIL